MVTTSATPTKSTAVIEIERLGFGWTEVADFDLTRLDRDHRVVQVREVGHRAPKDNVEQYAIAMGETAFPPIVVTSDDWIVDGNTRVAARAKRKEKFCSAFVLDAEYGRGSQKQKAMLDALAATLNQTGAQRLTQKEIRDVAAKLVSLNWKTDQIGRAIGAKPSTVTQVKREIAAASKLDRVGMSNGAVKGASLRALGAEKVVELNDVPFKELASLAADAGFNAGEIGSTAKEIRELGSDTAAVDRLKALRVEMNDRIRERELTGIGKPPTSRQLRQRLGFVTKFVGREQELIETDPNVNAMHLDALNISIAVLTEVLRMQKGSG